MKKTMKRNWWRLQLSEEFSIKSKISIDTLLKLLKLLTKAPPLVPVGRHEDQRG